MTDKDRPGPGEDTLPAMPGDSLQAGRDPSTAHPDSEAAAGNPAPSSAVPLTDARARAGGGTETDGDTPASPPVMPAPPRVDLGARLLGLAGVVIALGIGATTILPTLGLGSAARMAALESRLNEVAATRAVVRTPEMPDLAPLDARIGAMESALADLRAQAADAAAGHDMAAVQAALSALDARIATLSGRVDAVPGNDAMPAARDEQFSELEARLTALETGGIAAGGQTAARLDQLDDALDAERAAREAGDAAMMATLDARLSSLRDEVAALSARATAADTAAGAEVARQAALVLAMGRLRDAAATGASFAGAWQSVTRLEVDATAWPVIAEAAVDGVPTVADLRRRFAAAGDAAITADTLGETDSVVGGALNRIGNLVRIRRTGDVEGEGVQARVARAEQRLGEGNLQAALGEMAALPPDAAGAGPMQAWVRDAGRRLALDEAVAALQASVFETLARGG